MDHVIAPLDADHARVVAQLSADLASALGIEPARAAPPPSPHITVASYTGLEPPGAVAALAPRLAKLAACAVRAHGYGIFTG